MPLSPEHAEAVKTFAAAIAGADAKEVADALKGEAPPVYQAAFQPGHSTATRDAKARLDAKQAEVDAAVTERDAAREEATRLAAANPDHAAEKTRLEAALVAQKATDEATKTGAERVKALHAARTREALTAKLIEKGVDADYAREVLAAKAAARIRVGDPAADGTAEVSFLDADMATPLTSGLDGLAGQFVAGLDPKWVRSDVAGGGGATGSGGSSGSQWDRVRQEAKDRHKAPDQTSLNERRNALLPQN